VLHHCDNPSCVRFTHLFLGTPADNSTDMIQKNRTNGPKGERSAQSKLTNKDVTEIRRLRREGMSCRSIALRFPVKRKAVEAIVAGRTWSHLP
jgi:DNA-binding NarL/FixJ family response regulator